VPAASMTCGTFIRSVRLAAPSLSPVSPGSGEHYPRVYRAVLLEAGHLCQTLCLTATWLGLAPFCTIALADTKWEKLLGIDGINESLIYAAGAGLRPEDESLAHVKMGADPRLLSS